MKTKLVIVLLLLCCKYTWAQTTFFAENMGTPSGTTTITANTFQNSTPITYSNGLQANSADVRNTSQSSTSYYFGASGGGNIYFTSTNAAYGFSIEGINASNYNTLSLQFGYKKETVSSHAAFSIEYWNGTSWSILANTSSALFNEGSGAGAIWYLSKNLSLPTDAQINGLKIRFVKTGNVAIRIDDVILKGYQTAPSVTNTEADNITEYSATFAGNVTATGGSSITATGTVYSPTATNSNPVVGGTGVINLATSSPNSGTGSFSNNTGAVLSPNVQYSYNAYATKSTGLKGYGTVATFYTLAVTPYAPIITNATGNTLSITIDSGDNPAITTYSILETTTSKYVQVNGTLGTTPVYQTAETWGTKTVSGLLPLTTYSFEVNAKNGDGIVTAPSDPTSETTLTQANITVSGTLVALNTVYGTASAFTSFTVSADNLTDNLNITAPDGYEISKSNGGIDGYDTTLTLSQTSGAILTTTVYVRLASTATIGSYGGNVILNSVNDGITESIATAISNIATKDVTISGVIALNKVYNGNTVALLGGAAILNGILVADVTDIVLETSSVTATFADAVMGIGKPVTVTGYFLSGDKADNYNLIQPSGLTADITGNTSSDVILNTSSSTSTNQNMDYMTYQGTALSSTSNSNGVMGFRVRDGGGSNDADNLATELTAITFTVTNAANLRCARIFVGNSPKGTTLVVPAPDVNGMSTLTFTGLTGIVAPDNGDLAVHLRVTFNSAVTDNQQMLFKIVSVTAKNDGSLFASANGGGATSLTTGNINRIIVEADRLAFAIQPNDTYVGSVMNPAPGVKAIDAFGNTDLDYSYTISMTSSGTLSGSPNLGYVVNGIAHFNNIVHTATGSGFVLTATSTSLTSATSGMFSIDSNNPNNPNDPTPGGDPNPGGISTTPSYHDTQGKLNISNSGQAVYTLPIALPPSISNVGPTINLVYSSGQFGGVAGQGWNINSISYISRVSARPDIDGIKDGVDFDDNDKLALDGQRLLVKSGSTYWADGSLYETEVQSNNKIQLMGTGSNIYFIVTSPDGSRSWYGNYAGMNATDLSAYYIVRYEDANGNFILYNYSKPLNKTLCIDTIQFSANTISNPTPLNYIKFNYTTAAKTEKAYFKATLIEKAELLKKVKVYTDGSLFKEYRLFHISDSQLGYQRVSKIQEFNGAGEGANPVIFEYNITEDTVNETTTSYTDSFAPNEAPQLSGDFDGDGRMDFISNNKLYLKTFLSTATTPVTLPSLAARKFAATIVKDNKLNQSQTIIDLTMNLESIVFKYYGYNPYTNTVAQENTKTITMDNSALCSNACEGSPYADANLCNETKKKTASTSIEGDFNGDGISEVIFATYDESYEYGIDPTLCLSADPEMGGEELCLCSLINHPISNTPSQVLMINLDTNASTTIGSQGVAVLTGLGISRSYLDKTLVGDYNSDGKSDILVVKANKSYKVYSFTQLNVSPWVTVEVIGEGVLDSYASDKPFLLGDYNGDGKPDIMIPETDGECVPRAGYTYVNGDDETVVVPPVVCPNIDLWNIYYSNPNPAGGVFFAKKPTIVTNFNKRIGDDYFSYYPLDINKDGKTDVVKISVGLYNPGGFFDPTDVDSRWRIATYANNIGNNVGGATDFINTYNSPNGHNSDDNSVPIPIVADIKYRGLSSDLLMLRYHGNNSFAKKITYIDFTKNVNSDNSLKKVIQSNGGIVDEIMYNTMRSSEANAGFGIASDFYSSNNSVDYPALELKQIPSNKLVSKITNTAVGVTKSQDFKYNGYIVKLDGVGSIGFKRVARTAWYGPSDKKVWAVTEIDPLQRGSTKFTYTLQPSTADFSFPTNLSTGLISKTENIFTTSASGVFPYTILLQNQRSTDYITGIVKETIYNSYDAYNLPTSVTYNNYTGTTLEGTTTTVTAYDTPSFGTGSNYFIGRPHQITSIATAYGTTKKSLKTISYLNGNVSQIDKNVYEADGVTIDPVTMVEKMTYYPNGLLMDKEVSALGTTAGLNDVTARKVAYTYDPTNRFVSTITDPELLVSTNMSFHPIYGTVLEAKNPFNQTTTNVYDNWGKLINVTDNTLNLKTNYAYVRANNIYTTTITKTTTGGVSDGSSSIIDQDVLAREIRKGSKGLNGTWSYVATEYDAQGRRYRTSEPYFGSGSPSQWTVFAYDDYSRPTMTTSFTGKVVTTAYSGLTVTVDDSVMSKSKTIDANGQIRTTTDTPGGTINYKYDAAGSLLESDYEGVKITMVYDNWGRKTSLTDSSSGTNTYSYNAYGEVKTKGTPKGLTSYTYDGLSGRVLTESVQGLTTADATNIVSAYNYNATTKLLESMTVTNPNDGNSTFDYTYDSQRRLYKTEETQSLLTSGTVVFTKQLTFDNFSRIDTETNTATAFGKTNTKTVKYSYSNGLKNQVKDNITLANLWQANTADARSNILTATLGNGINITNTFDQYGYASQFQHKLGTADIMTLNTVFDPVLGNLSSRYNSMFDLQENFTYDALDRLTDWDGSSTNLLTLPFNTTTDGFIFSGTSTQGSVSNASGKLKVTLKNTTVYAGRDLNITTVPGKKITIRGDISNKTAFNGTVAKLQLVETDANDDWNYIEYPILTVANGAFDLDYIVTDNFENTKLSLKFIIEEGPNCPSCPNYWLDDGEEGSDPITAAATFYLDNLKIDEIAITSQEYDDRGRITSNSVGQYQYDATHPYRNNSIEMTSDALNYYNGRPQQDVAYNAFKAPVTIEEQGIDLISFGYNAFQQRSVMYYGDTGTDKLSKPYRKYYSADGSMEIKATFASGNNSTPVSVEFMTYIDGNAYSAPIVLKSDGTTQEYFYLHRDYQGSILAITNASGAIVEKRLFDAWGGLVKVQDGGGNPLTQLTFFDRGYTGHEHLLSVGLINMNARLYDPKLHRFLQPDSYVQDPFNTQNYNRYSYCVNNPTKYTDVTGNIFNIATLASCIPVVGSIFSSLLMHQGVDWDRVAVDVVITGISIAVTAGIGSAVTTISNFYVKAAVSALAHGVFQGGLSAVTGGKFWAGFAAGALSSIASSVWQGGTDTAINSKTGLRESVAGTGFKGIGGKFANSVVGTLSFGAVMGGAGSVIGGGNFWQGAVTGLIVAGFNHLLHDEDGTQTNEKTDTQQETIYSENQILKGENGPFEVDVNVEYRYKIVNGQKVIIDNSVKIHTMMNDNISPLDTYYENKQFKLTVNPKYTIKNGVIVFEATGTHVSYNLKLGGVGFEVHPIIYKFTGVVNTISPSATNTFVHVTTVTGKLTNN